MAKWQKTDRPMGSEHIDAGRCGGRVRPVSGGWEWSTWVGEPGRRVLNNIGTLKSKSAAKHKAVALCKR